MQHETVSETASSRHQQASSQTDQQGHTDQADYRDPQPRDPVAHPHFRVRPPVARRIVVDQAVASADEAGDFPQ